MIQDIFSFCMKCKYITTRHSPIENVRLCLKCARQTIQYQRDIPIHFNPTIVSDT